MEWVRIYWSMVSFRPFLLDQVASTSGTAYCMPSCFVSNQCGDCRRSFLISKSKSTIIEKKATDIHDNADHDHRSRNSGRRAISTFPHASLEALPRLHVRRNGLERAFSRPPRHRNVRRSTYGTANESVMAIHPRSPLHFRSWNLRRKWKLPFPPCDY
jgi:hypothetical protein